MSNDKPKADEKVTEKNGSEKLSLRREVIRQSLGVRSSLKTGECGDSFFHTIIQG